MAERTFFQPSRHTYWVHGNAAQFEFGDALDSVLRKGWGTHFLGKENTANWFHIPFTIPVVQYRQTLHLVKVFVLYTTLGDANTSTAAKITDVHVYDGSKSVKEFHHLNLSGNHVATVDASNSWDIAPEITLGLGLGISVGVEFGPRVEGLLPQIHIAAAGADFESHLFD